MQINIAMQESQEGLYRNNEFPEDLTKTRSMLKFEKLNVLQNTIETNEGFPQKVRALGLFFFCFFRRNSRKSLTAQVPKDKPSIKL